MLVAGTGTYKTKQQALVGPLMIGCQVRGETPGNVPLPGFSPVLASPPCNPTRSVHSFQTSLLVLTREVRSPGQKGAYEESLACPLTLGCIHCHDLSMTGFFDLKVPSMQETIHYPGSFPLPSADWHLRLAFLYVQNLRL